MPNQTGNPGNIGDLDVHLGAVVALVIGLGGGSFDANRALILPLGVGALHAGQ